MDPGQTRQAAGRSVAGLVLSGGLSTRFGSEKAAALLAGKPLLIWAAERLRASCGAVAVSARPGSAAQALAEAHGLPVLHDADGDASGPLAGIKAGLAWAGGIGARALAVSPCDAPLLPPDLFARLIAAAGDGGAAMAATADGRQPLCAIWPVDTLPMLTDVLAGGAHPAVWQVLERLDARTVMFDDAAAFANLNTQAELAAVAASFDPTRPQAAKR